jgi:calcium-dependent protein kinase
VSEPAKDCVRKMLVRDPRKRSPAATILRHEWMKDNGVASDKPIEVEVLKRIRGFAANNRLKKEALLVIAKNLPLEEIEGLKKLFLEMDKVRCGSLCHCCVIHVDTTLNLMAFWHITHGHTWEARFENSL